MLESRLVTQRCKQRSNELLTYGLPKKAPALKGYKPTNLSWLVLCETIFEKPGFFKQLLQNKAHCPFTHYMANKSDKFGIQFWTSADAETKCILKGRPYLVKDEHRPSKKNLTEPYFIKGRNITTNNFLHQLP